MYKLADPSWLIWSVTFLFLVSLFALRLVSHANTGYTAAWEEASHKFLHQTCPSELHAPAKISLFVPKPIPPRHQRGKKCQCFKIFMLSPLMRLLITWEAVHSLEALVKPTEGSHVKAFVDYFNATSATTTAVKLRRLLPSCPLLSLTSRYRFLSVPFEQAFLVSPSTSVSPLFSSQSFSTFRILNKMTEIAHPTIKGMNLLAWSKVTS